jgi:DNA-binding transcriptional LysR family regulator
MDGAMQLSDRIGRRIKLHDLHVLMAVVQAGSMSRAAQLLNTTQPAVSKSIADLEPAVGVRLLDRGRHGAEPTVYGRALLDGGTAMFDDLRQAVKNIEFLADPTVGEVKIMATDPIIVGVVPAVLDRLRWKFPGISVHVTPIVTDIQRARDLRERRFDLYLGRITPPIE